MATQKRFQARAGLDNNSQTIIGVADPVNAQDAATKAFSSNASNLAAGTLPAARLPAFTGDASVAVGTSTITLSNSGATAGTYKSVTVDAKGRVTAGTNPTTLAGYGITDAVTSVAGKTGVVTLVKADVGLGNVDNTSDLSKPISTATQNALDLKAPLTSPALNGTPTSPTAVAGTNTNQIASTAFVTTAVSTKANTSHTHIIGDVTGLQSALDLKANLASPALTGTPTAPTPANGSNNTQIATTAFVLAQIGATGASGSAAISGGSIDGAAIGGTTPAAGNFTNLSSTTLNIGGATLINGSSSAMNIDYTGGSTQYGITLQATTPGATTAINFFNSVGANIGSISQTDAGITFNGTATSAPWSGITGKPTTLTGYGITDAAPSSHVGATGAAHGVATTSVAGFMSSTDKTKLDGISASSVVGTALGTAAIGVSTSYARADHVHPVQTTVSGNAGTATSLATTRTISASGDATWSVSFNGSADATAALTLAASGATAGTYKSVTVDAKGRVTAGSNPTTLAGYGITDAVSTASRGVANGVATLDASGLVPSTQLPSYVDDVLEYANLAGFPATGETSKIYVALDTNKTYRWSGTAYVYITSGAVDSVAGKTGVVTLVKGDVGLGNVDNTSDLNKPVSTAQQTALNLKADLTSPALTGTPSAPTATAGTNTTQLATTAFVTAAVGGKANTTHTHAIADVTGLQTALDGKQVADADLTAIAGLAGISGFLKKTAANTWSLDTASYITGNQSITVSGDASGAGTTAISLTLANSGVTAGTYNNSATQNVPLVIDAKGRVTGTGAAVTITPAWSSITGKPTTLSGYGITDALGLAGGTLTGALNLPSNGLNVGSGQLTVSGGNVSASGTVTAVNVNATTSARVGGTGAIANTTFYVQGTVAQNVTAVAATDIAWNAGNYFTKTITGATTFTFSSFPASGFVMLTLKLTNGGVGAITWPASVKWPGGTMPTLTTAGVDIINLFTDDGGVTVYGILAGKGMA